MLVKAVLVFLVAMAVLAWIGGWMGKLRKRRGPRAAAACPACGRPRIGPAPCPCGRAS